MWQGGWGVSVSVGVQTSILHPNEVQRVLTTPSKPFYVMLSISVLGAGRNLVKSRFWSHFLTILYIKIVYFLVLYFICRFFLPWVGLYSIEFEAIWKICFACMKVYFEKIWSLFVTNYCIFLINRIRWLCSFTFDDIVEVADENLLELCLVYWRLYVAYLKILIYYWILKLAIE